MATNKSETSGNKNNILKLPIKSKGNSMTRILVTVISIILFAFIVVGFFGENFNINSKKVDISVILSDVKNNKIDTLKKDGNVLRAKFKDGKGEEYATLDPNTNVTTLLKDSGIIISNNNPSYSEATPHPIDFGSVVSLIFLVVGGFFMYSLLKQMRSSGGGLLGFGESKARLFWGKKINVTLEDVAGIREAKQELREIVEFLKTPKKYTSMGARIPKGVLLVGHPGTGKTLLAKAIAGEAGVPFFSVGGSEFEEMVVGAGAARVRDLFGKARKASPSIIFIDEIDAIGRRRGNVMNSGHTEQTLNQILVEMDGFDSSTNVIVIGATNRPDVLDPALLRPGRFDRTVTLDLPNVDERKEILAIHARNKPLDPNLNFDDISRRTTGFSGADLENMLNESAILAANAGRKIINRDDLEEAATKVTMGPAKRRTADDDKDLKIVAYHEAGHALVAKFLPESDPVYKISIIPRGMSAGSTTYLPEKDATLNTKTKMITSIVHAMGGYTAEKLVFGDVTNGASDDIRKATKIARKMVTDYGMSDELGPVLYGYREDFDYNAGFGDSQEAYSQETAYIIDKEVKYIMQNAYTRATEIITKYRHKLDKIVDVLMEKEVIEGEEFNKIFEDIKIAE